MVKRIRIRDPDGGEEIHEERVRLFSLADLEPVLPEMRLSVYRIFGDERGRDFSPASSPRMGLLLRRLPE